jgi:hypothetical protein
MSVADTTADTTPRRWDALRAGTIALHLAIVAGVCVGWQMNSRIGLFLYMLLLPLIMMQWLFNRGSSFIGNLENMQRTGHWRDPRNPYEGRFFQVLLRKVGVDISPFEVGLLLTIVMAVFWLVATYRMVLIA